MEFKFNILGRNRFDRFRHGRNILMDTFFQEKFQKNFDDNGNFASLGNPKIKYINKFLTDEFFIAKYLNR